MKYKHVRSFLAFVLCAAMGISMTACGESAFSVTGEAEALPGAEAKTTITVMCSQGWVEDAERKLGRRFEEETGIHVDYQIVPADQYQDLLQTRLNSGQGPDIWGAQSGFALRTTYNVEDNAVDLSDEPWADSYNVFSAEETGVDGVNYGLTYYDTTTDYYMVYNKKLFEKAGASVPKTFDELLDTCEKLKAYGVNPIYEPLADGWHLLILWTESGQVHEKLEPGIIDRLNENETTFAESANMKKALDELKELADRGYFGETFMVDEVTDSEDRMAAGEYAMSMMRPGSIETILNSPRNKGYTEDDFGLFLFPLLDNQYLNIHPTGPSRFIYSGSPNIEAAKQYLAYLLEKENVQYLIDNAAEVENLPVEVGQTPEYSRTTLDFLSGFDEEDSGMVLQDVVLYFNEQWMEINADLASMLNDEKTSEEVLAAIDKRRAQLARAAGDIHW